MRVVAPAANQAFRLSKFYKRPTTIVIQIKHPTAKFFFDFDQGSAQSGGGGTGTDGFCLMAANTNPVVTPAAYPFQMTVEGEVWYSCDTAQADFVFAECLAVTLGGTPC